MTRPTRPTEPSAPCPGAGDHGANRRDFLRGAGALAVGAAMAGCAKKSTGSESSGTKEAMPAAMDPKVAERPRNSEARRPARPAEPARATGAAYEVPSSVAGRGVVFGAEHGGLKDKDDLPARAPLEKMLDHLLAELTGKTKPEEAWSLLFRPDDVVALKPNTLGRDPCSPSPALVTLLVERLRAVGVKPENIYIFDRPHFEGTKLLAALKAGSAAQGGPLSGIRVGLMDEFGYDPKEVKISTGQTEKLSNVIHRATAILNVPVWKDHGLAGVTGAVKNIGFGMMPVARAFHPNACTPAVCDFYNLPMVRPKVRLTVADVHRVIIDGGPRGDGKPEHNVWTNRLYATRDPVALDRLQWQELDRLRKGKALPLLMKRGKKGGKEGTPIHVLHAASLGLGEATLEKIKLTMKRMG